MLLDSTAPALMPAAPKIAAGAEVALLSTRALICSVEIALRLTSVFASTGLLDT